MVDPARSLRAAVGRLEALRENGLWRGFPTLAGQSDVWVSAFVASHLVAVEVGEFDAAPTVAGLLDARHDDGGWGYNREVPTDADSTAWCTVALTALGGQEEPRKVEAACTAETVVGLGPAIAAAREVLESHRRGDGYATYRSDSGIAAYIGASSAAAVVGWTAPHPDVSAAVLLAGVPPAESEGLVTGQLVAAQTGAGFVSSYWWRGPFYGSALLLRALTARRHRLVPDAEGLMYRGLARMQLADGGFGLGAAQVLDPFSTALGLEALCRLGHLDEDQRRDRAAEALLAAQREDGGWNGEYVLRIPAPHVTDPRHVDVWQRDTGGGNNYVRDVDGLFATALSAYALDVWRRGPADLTEHEPVEAAQPDRADEAVVRPPAEPGGEPVVHELADGDSGGISASAGGPGVDISGAVDPGGITNLPPS